MLPRPIAAIAALLLLVLAGTPLHAHPGTGIVVDRAGNVYFVILGRSEIMRLGLDGQVRPFVSDDRLRFPHHLVMGADGSIYTAADHDGVIWRADSSGGIRPFFNSTQFARRTRVRLAVGSGGDPFTVDALGRVYTLATPGGSAVVRVDDDTSVAAIVTSIPMGGLHFSAMTAASDGSVYVSDGGRVWRVRGDTARAFIVRGLEHAAGLTVDGSGNLIVADYRGGRIARFDSSGRENTPASFQSLRLRHPTGVATMGDDVYVLDYRQGATSVWRLRGHDAERLYVAREPGHIVRRIVSLLPLALVVLVGIALVQRRRNR